MSKREDSYLSLLAAAGSISINFGVALVLGLYIGKAVDERLGSTPWGIGIGALLGFVAGLWSVAKIIMKGKMRNNG
jgi:F0F1-type ATP synthase assembly protein I